MYKKVVKKGGRKYSYYYHNQRINGVVRNICLGSDLKEARKRIENQQGLSALHKVALHRESKKTTEHHPSPRFIISPTSQPTHSVKLARFFVVLSIIFLGLGVFTTLTSQDISGQPVTENFFSNSFSALKSYLSSTQSPPTTPTLTTLAVYEQETQSNKKASSKPAIISYYPNYTKYWMKNNQSLDLNIRCSVGKGEIFYGWTMDKLLVSNSSNFILNGANYPVGKHNITGFCMGNSGNLNSKEFMVEIIDKDDFTLIVLPDTQDYSKTYPQIFTAQTEWVKNLKENLGIMFVTHLGDVVDDVGITSQLANANRSMRTLDGIVPYGLTIGNHDYDVSPADRNLNNFMAYFPIGRYNAQKWWGGQYSAASMANTYQYFSAGGMDFMIFHLEFCPSDAVLDWVNQSITNNASKQVIISTHQYLDNDDTHIDSNDKYNCAQYNLSESNDGEEAWERTFKNHENVFLILSGHILGDGEGYLTSTGTHGNLVHQILSNYQALVTGSTNGGNGYLRIMRFSKNDSRIYIRAYSPFLDDFHPGNSHNFFINYETKTGEANQQERVTEPSTAPSLIPFTPPPSQFTNTTPITEQPTTNTTSSIPPTTLPTPQETNTTPLTPITPLQNQTDILPLPTPANQIVTPTPTQETPIILNQTTILRIGESEKELPLYVNELDFNPWKQSMPSSVSLNTSQMEELNQNADGISRPLVRVVVQREVPFVTREIVNESGDFSINLPSVAQGIRVFRISDGKRTGITDTALFKNSGETAGIPLEEKNLQEKINLNQASGFRDVTASVILSGKNNGGIVTKLFSYLAIFLRDLFSGESYFQATGYASYESSSQQVLDSNATISVNDLNQGEVLELYYTLPGPSSTETLISETRKQVTISSGIHYTDVLAYTYLGDLNQNAKNVNVFWLADNTKTRVKSTPYDLDGNGYIDYVEWDVPGLSNQTYEISLEILNVQSYPIVGDIWEVKFNTTGTANLLITPVEGTTWSSPTETNPATDLQFYALKCGEDEIDYEWTNNSVFVEDYNCDEETSYEQSRVFTTGKHVLEFRFGNEIAYARNLASVTNVQLSSVGGVEGAIGNNLSVTYTRGSQNTKEIIIWKVGQGAAKDMMVLHLPFEMYNRTNLAGSGAYFKDYTWYSNNGTKKSYNTAGVWSWSEWNQAGYDGINYSVNMWGSDVAGDQIQVADHYSLDWTQYDNFSVGVWINQTQDPAATEVIIGKYSAWASWWVGVLGASGDVPQFYMRDAGTDDDCTATGTTDVVDGKYHYLLATRNNTDNLLFLDGALEAHCNREGFDQSITNSQILTIGYFNANPNYYWVQNMEIDDVEMWNNSMTAAQVRMKYNNHSDMIDSSMLYPGQVWQACVMAFNSTEDTVSETCSNTVTIFSAECSNDAGCGSGVECIGGYCFQKEGRFVIQNSTGANLTIIDKTGQVAFRGSTNAWPACRDGVPAGGFQIQNKTGDIVMWVSPTNGSTCYNSYTANLGINPAIPTSLEGGAGCLGDNFFVRNDTNNVTCFTDEANGNYIWLKAARNVVYDVGEIDEM